MRILFLCNKIYWDRKVPRTRFHVVEAMREFADIEINGVGFLGWNDAMGVYNNYWASDRMDWPDAILVYKPEDYHGWDDPRLPPVVTTFNDAWDVEQRTKDIRLPRARLVIMHHANEVDEWRKRCPDVKFVHIPYGINPEIFKDYGLEKDIDILLTGAIDDGIYPLRARFRRLILAGAFNPYNAVIRPHPGYRIDSPGDEAVDYARMLNRAKICLADTSRYLYCPEKYFEIPACRSVVYGNSPDVLLTDLSPHMFHVGDTWPDEILVEPLLTLLKCYSTECYLQSVTNHGYECVHANYTSAHYAQRFITAVEEMLAAQ